MIYNLVEHKSKQTISIIYIKYDITVFDHNRFHNNMFCVFPEKVIDFVTKTTVPVMGFKGLAARAIEPKDGFQWAYDNGDFIYVGMFGFQLVSNVNIAIDCLNKTKRTREWYG